jgi:hypothetical protein
MKKAAAAPILIIILFFSLGQDFFTTEENQPTDVFLKKSGLWEGEFANLVNQDNGVIQKGKIRMQMEVDSQGIIKQRIAIIRPDGTATDYSGYSTMKVEGNRLEWIGSMTMDENTGNPIENHVFDGYVGWNQIYAVETYEEIFPDGRREKRRNNLHYIILSQNKVLWLADVHLNGKLLVFANTLLVLQEEKNNDKDNT